MAKKTTITFTQPELQALRYAAGNFYDYDDVLRQEFPTPYKRKVFTSAMAKIGSPRAQARLNEKKQRSRR